MARTTIQLPNGTVINIDGTVEEVAKLVEMYGSGKAGNSEVVKYKKTKPQYSGEGEVDILSLVNATKDAKDFDQIEKNILDQASQVDRVILPLFIAERTIGSTYTLTSNDVYKFLKEFGINMALPNISRTLSKTALKYVMASSARKKGVSTGYCISRKGKQYLEQILTK